MKAQPGRWTRLACVLAITAPAARIVDAQTALEGRPPVSISVGAGMLMPYSYPERPTTDLFVSVQVPVSRSLVVEAEVIRSTSDHVRSEFSTTDHESLDVGGKLLVRRGGPRLALFFGGGLGFQQAETRMRFDTTERSFVVSGPSWQLVGGIDGRIAPRLVAFGGARWLTSQQGGDTGLGALGGVRLALGAAAQEAPPRGPTVRVSLASGVRRTGELVSLTWSDVVVREEGQTRTFPLTQVSRVERTTHNVRNSVLWGLIVGFAGGYLGSCGGGDEEDCWPEVGALFAGIGAGTGALIGAGVNRATAESRVLYPTPQSTISLAPHVSPSRASVEMTIRF